MTRMHRKFWFVGLGLVAVLVAGTGFVVTRATSKPAAQPPLWFTGTVWQRLPLVRRAPNFIVPDQDRRPISLRHFRGHVTILSFTSSVCRQQCPIVGRELATVERILGPLAHDTNLVNLSVDPASDTKATVDHFAREMGWTRYHWYYLWSTRFQMLPIWDSYYVYVGNPPKSRRGVANVSHLAAVVLVDQEGRIRAYLSYPILPSGLAKAARDLIEGRD